MIEVMEESKEHLVSLSGLSSAASESPARSAIWILLSEFLKVTLALTIFFVAALLYFSLCLDPADHYCLDKPFTYAFVRIEIYYILGSVGALIMLSAGMVSLVCLVCRKRRAALRLGLVAIGFYLLRIVFTYIYGWGIETGALSGY